MKSKHKAGLVLPPKINTKVYFNIKALKFKDCLILIQIDIYYLKHVCINLSS